MPHSNNSVCLVDFRLTGHHPLYISHFAQAFQKLGYDVDIFCSDTKKCEELLLKALPSLDLNGITFIHSDAAAKKQKRVLGCRSYFRLIKLEREIERQEKVKENNYALVFFAYLDDVVHIDFILPYLIRAPFSKNFSGLLMNPGVRTLKDVSLLVSLLTTSLIERKNSAFSELGLVVENVRSEVENKIGKKTVIYPDFCSHTRLSQIKSPLENQLETEKKGRKVTCLLGSISPHKSIDLMLNCLKVSDPKEHFFLIAGKINWHNFEGIQHDKLKEIILNPPENLLIYDGWLDSEAEFDTLIQKSDLLFAYYRDFKKSSNVLTKGAFYRVPVIVSNKYLMGERVRNYKLGYALEEQEVVALYKQKNLEKFHYDEKLVEEFVYKNSVERLPEIFSDILTKEN